MKKFYIHCRYNNMAGNVKYFIAIIEANNKDEAINRFQEKYKENVFLDKIHQGVDWIN